MDLQIDKIIKANEITFSTMLGVDKSKYPVSYGNCFSVEISGGHNYRIVNFHLENLQQLIKIKTISFPIDILPISEHLAVICDGRIPNEYYCDRFCEACTPLELLPAPQRIKQLLDIKRGIREEKAVTINGKDGKLVSIKIEPNRHKTDWEVI